MNRSPHHTDNDRVGVDDLDTAIRASEDEDILTTSSLLKQKQVADLLLRCEEQGPAHHYAVGGGVDPRILLHDVEGRHVFVVSDLHVAAGLGADRTYGGTENFFNDDAFARFVEKMNQDVGGDGNGSGGTLVINGDVIDFIRIVEVPQSDEEFTIWSRMLADIGIDRSPEWLRESIIPKEVEFGLRTQDYKSVWRLYRSMAGHEPLFRGLARWLASGKNELVIVKGNHDLEWYWAAVRNGLRLELARMIAEESGEDADGEQTHDERGNDLFEILRKRVLPNLYFIDDAVLIDNDLYIEHGHRYDRYTYVLGDPAQVYDRLRNELELNIPFGSFFNRYLLNRLEGAYPFLDNIRPRENILPLVIRERFPLAVNLLFRHIIFLFKVIGKEKRYIRFMFGRVFALLIVILLPLIFLVIGVMEAIEGTSDGLLVRSGDATTTAGQVMEYVLDGFRYIGGLILSYVLARLVAWLQLVEPDSLEKPAREILQNIEYRFATMGHTHNPNQFQVEGRFFYNTGTWIPIVESSSAELRSDRVYPYLHFSRDPKSGRLEGNPLRCWNDSAGRGELLAIVRRASG